MDHRALAGMSRSCDESSKSLLFIVKVDILAHLPVIVNVGALK